MADHPATFHHPYYFTMVQLRSIVMALEHRIQSNDPTNFTTPQFKARQQLNIAELKSAISHLNGIAAR